MQYCIRSYSNPANRKEVTYHASPVYTGKITLTDVTDDLAEATSLNPVDVKAVINGLITNIPKYVAKGNKVFLGELGIFSLSFKSQGHLTADEVSSTDIKEIHVAFRASSILKKTSVNKASFTYNGTVTNGSASKETAAEDETSQSQTDLQD